MKSYARGDIGQAFANAYRLPTPKHTPFAIGYTFEGKPHEYLPDVVGTLTNGKPFIAEAGMEDDKRGDRNLAKAEAARHFGAASMLLIEPSFERRGYADASRVDRAFDPRHDAADVARLGVDVVLECSGNEHSTRAGLAALTPQGTMVVVGGGAHAGLDPLTILLKGLRVQGSFTYVDEFNTVIHLLADGALPVADLTTAIVGIDVAPEAFDRLRDARTMKVFIAPNG